MREHTALLRAAWREQAPVLALALVLALGSWWWSLKPKEMPSAWTVLALLPAALQLGVVAGRSSPRSLAFWFARPGLRTQLLRARVQVAGAILAFACAVVVVPCLVRDPHPDVVIVALFAGAALVLAFACSLVASTLTDREPLAFGVGTLLFTSVPLVLLLPTEALGITPPRVLLAAPLGIVAAIAVLLVGCGSAVIRSWRERLPVRDRAHMRALLVRCAGAWFIAQVLCGASLWTSADAERGLPTVVLGSNAGGLLIASGSRGSLDGESVPRVDAVIREGEAIEVVLDATGRTAMLDRKIHNEVVSAAMAGDTLVLGLADPRNHGEWQRLLVVEPGRAPRSVADGVTSYSLSPTGKTLFVDLRQHGELIDVATGEVRPSGGHNYDAWIGEEILWVDRQGRDEWDETHYELVIGERRIATPPLSHPIISPDGFFVAAQLERSGPSFRGDVNELPTHIRVLDMQDETFLDHELDFPRLSVLCWLDDDHIAFTSRDSGERRTTLHVMDAHVGTVAEVGTVPFGIQITHIEGPPEGPWLLSRAGGKVQALAPAGVVLWEERVETLAADRSTARRWAKHAGEVVGIDPRGRMWRHPLPWREQP